MITDFVKPQTASDVKLQLVCSAMEVRPSTVAAVGSAIMHTSKNLTFNLPISATLLRLSAMTLSVTLL